MPGRTIPVITAVVVASLASMTVNASAAAQIAVASLGPPGRLVDVGGYRLHLWCAGPTRSDRPTVVLSIGGGGFAVDWALIQRPLSDSVRVCSYDRAGWAAGPALRAGSVNPGVASRAE
jgi:hypothetical protein